jgi:DinB superfamily
MSETPQQYTNRILGYLAGQDPISVLKATPATLDRVLDSVPQTVLNQHPAPGKWSVGEILAHLADAELVVGFRMRFILGAPGSPIAAFDQDQWAIAGHFDRRDHRLSVATIRALREANVALLELLDPEQWKHFGIHAERGQESIEQMVRMLAGHDLNHLRQIERMIGRALK